MPPDLVSLNLEYLILRIYQLFLGGSLTPSDLPRYAIDLIHRLSWLGVVVSALLLVPLVYLRVRLGSLEDSGWREREEQELEATGRVAAKNPRWDGVVALANSSHPSDWRRAILEADIMLNDLLRERGYAGESVGEQLRGASPFHFTSLDLAWQAHKTRNDVAHGGESFPLSERDARATVVLYRRVFEEFDYV